MCRLESSRLGSTRLDFPEKEKNVHALDPSNDEDKNDFDVS